jgi:hypothetical protein
MFSIDDNFHLYALYHYNNENGITLIEFEEDLKRIGYIKKLLKKYKGDQKLKYRLILNHLIVLYNSFGHVSAHLLLYKIDTEKWPILYTFLAHLNQLPRYYNNYAQLDFQLIEQLQTL